MDIRSTRTTLTFRKPFTLPLSDRTMPPGDYVLLTEEERLEGLTFNAYRRVARYLIVSGGPEFPGRTEMIPVNDAEMAELVACDM
ncbi:hypothetical protein [Rhodobacter sp. SY28-1]|uniref:hypothetical protein n=1 Tax=Rhodobacter sp. SY28-1 TaxID=2562317 RepID=UPI0010BF6C71|nr:hypothetical protein [Rhodobacter sp. SY28-1]